LGEIFRVRSRLFLARRSRGALIAARAVLAGDVGPELVGADHDEEVRAALERLGVEAERLKTAEPFARGVAGTAEVVGGGSEGSNNTPCFHLR